MPTPVKAFLSYAAGDREFANRLTAALRDAAIDISSDADIAVGSDWGDHLRAAMGTADAVIFLVTPASVASAGVMSEIGAAVATGKAIIPVVTTDRGLPAGLPAPLRRWQFLRAGKDDLGEVALAIREQLARRDATPPEGTHS